ncbi:hypothetical protein EJB05_04679 [Eragrostis curvula]|uniref:Uncharacterized protein n=1 Tax=Eragrostis curvula TaxID=38414 RepID=A0A5J9WB46_9POAL|nr:hypothetical protein EJB05_04679 [Eragrostis curvula]
MASINFPQAATVLIFGLLILGAVVEPTEAVCNVSCVRKGHITWRNYPGQQIPGCDCMCAPPDGRHCFVHMSNGMARRCWRGR